MIHKETRRYLKNKISSKTCIFATYDIGTMLRNYSVSWQPYITFHKTKVSLLKFSLQQGAIINYPSDFKYCIAKNITRRIMNYA